MYSIIRWLQANADILRNVMHYVYTGKVRIVFVRQNAQRDNLLSKLLTINLDSNSRECNF